jgi:hypothetical protein
MSEAPKPHVYEPTTADGHCAECGHNIVASWHYVKGADYAALRQRHAEAEAQTCATCRHRFVGMAPAGRPHFTYCKRTKVPVPALGTQTYVECRELGMRCGAWLASDAKARLT